MSSLKICWKSAAVAYAPALTTWLPFPCALPTRHLPELPSTSTTSAEPQHNFDAVAAPVDSQSRNLCGSVRVDARMPCCKPVEE